MKVLAFIVLVVVLTIWDVTGSPLEYEEDNLQNTVAVDGAISRFPLGVESRFRKWCPSFFPWCG